MNLTADYHHLSLIHLKLKSNQNIISPFLSSLCFPQLWS